MSLKLKEKEKILEGKLTSREKGTFLANYLLLPMSYLSANCDPIEVEMEKNL